VAINAAPWAYCMSWDRATLAAPSAASVLGFEAAAVKGVLDGQGWVYGADWQFLCLPSV
jgi:hypothetical protein